MKAEQNDLSYGDDTRIVTLNVILPYYCHIVFQFVVLFRITQQLSSCDSAGQMSVSALMAIRAWVWTAGWWSFSGFLTRLLWTPKNPFCMTSLWRTDWSGYFQTAPCFMLWGSHLLLIVSYVGCLAVHHWHPDTVSNMMFYKGREAH